MTKTSQADLRSLALSSPRIGGAALRAQETRSDDAADHRALAGLGARQRRADLARRLAHRLHAAARQQARRQVGVGAVDRERRRRRSTASSSRDRRRAGRPTASALLYLAEGEPKGSQIFVRWVDVDGPATQITHVAEAPRNARWSPDGKSIAFSMFVARAGEVDDQHAGRAEGREMDAGAARRRHAALPAGSGRLPRGRLHAPVRRAGRRRHAARS